MKRDVRIPPGSMPDRQRGFLMIVAVVLIVIAALVLTTMVYLSATSNDSGAGNLQSGQALFVAESGLEYEQRQLAQDVDWYRSNSDPMLVATSNIGQGSFSVSTNLPATMLKKHVDTSVPVTIQVYSTDGFPNSGYLQIDDDVTTTGEFVQYSGKTATTFSITARGQTIGPVVTTNQMHFRDDNVYPVTTLVTSLTATCSSPPQSQIVVVDNTKFLSAGTVVINGEEISYTGLTHGSPNMTLSGVQRNIDPTAPCPGTIPPAHAAGEPVTPVLAGGVSNSASQQVLAVATGTVGTTQRTMSRVIHR